MKGRPGNPHWEVVFNQPNVYKCARHPLPALCFSAVGVSKARALQRKSTTSGLLAWVGPRGFGPVEDGTYRYARHWGGGQRRQV